MLIVNCITLKERPVLARDHSVINRSNLWETPDNLDQKVGRRTRDISSRNQNPQ
jgi:hypothetical protein